MMEVFLNLNDGIKRFWRMNLFVFIVQIEWWRMLMVSVATSTHLFIVNLLMPLLCVPTTSCYDHLFITSMFSHNVLTLVMFQNMMFQQLSKLLSRFPTPLSFIIIQLGSLPPYDIYSLQMVSLMNNSRDILILIKYLWYTEKIKSWRMESLYRVFY